MRHDCHEAGSTTDKGKSH